MSLNRHPVPEGQPDRSLARSAWENPSKEPSRRGAVWSGLPRLNGLRKCQSRRQRYRRFDVV